MAARHGEAEVHKGGQNHPGLGSVSSDRILSALSPGINVLTIHPRQEHLLRPTGGLSK